MDNDVVVIETMSSKPVSTCPFAEGDIWIGSLENRKYRARMQVSEVSVFGPWIRCLGYRVKCILDIAPTSTGTHYERRDGIEEVACEIIGYVHEASSSSATDNNCVFELGRYLGMFGSYIGDLPSLSEDRLPLGLIGICTTRDFFAGQIVEQQQSSSRRYYNGSSLYSQPKPFCLIRWNKDVVDPELAENLTQMSTAAPVFGPPKPPSHSAISLVTLQQRKSFDSIGQPAAFTIPANTSIKQLYDLMIERFTRKIQAKLTVNGVDGVYNNGDGPNMNSNNNDPFGIRGLFRLIQRFPGEHYTRFLDDSDDESLVTVNTAENALSHIILTAEWDILKLSDEHGNLYDALFGNLYNEDFSDGDGKRMTKLYDCFDMFSEEEKLSSTETWYCSNCKAHKEAFKKMQLWQLPPVLVVHLKRFSQSQSSYFVDKDDTEIDFPLEGLDLRDRVRSPKAKDDCVYDLVAVSHHYGGLGGGHYVAHARNEADGNSSS
jgi:hypothetical protein